MYVFKFNSNVQTGTDVQNKVKEFDGLEYDLE